MKKFLAVACLLAVSAANAADVKFGDLNYFLKQGQFNAKADLDLSREFFAIDDGSSTTKSKIEGYVIKTRAAYGLTDTLTAFVGLNGLYEMDQQPKGGVSSESNGIQNPILGADLRIMNQNDAGFNVDVGAVLDVKVMDSTIAESNKDDGTQPALHLSNYGDPRTSLNLNARLGKKSDEANEFYAVAGLTYHMAGSQEDQDNNEDLDWDSSMDLNLGAFYQYRPVNEFMLTVGANATRYGEVDGELGNSDLTVQDHIDFMVSFSAKYLITENFIAKFNLAQDRRDDHKVEADSGDFDIERRQAFAYGVGVDFLF